MNAASSRLPIGPRNKPAFTAERVSRPRLRARDAAEQPAVLVAAQHHVRVAPQRNARRCAAPALRRAREQPLARVGIGQPQAHELVRELRVEHEPGVAHAVHDVAAGHGAHRAAHQSSLFPTRLTR